MKHKQNAWLRYCILKYVDLLHQRWLSCFDIYSGKHCACAWQCEYKGVLQAGPWGEGEENQGGGADAEWGQPR